MNDLEKAAVVESGPKEQFVPVTAAELPGGIMDALFGKSSPDKGPLEKWLGRAYRVAGSDHDIYVLEENSRGSRTVFVTDYVDGQHVGYTEIRCNEKTDRYDQSEIERARVLFTWTKGKDEGEEFGGRGFGTQRLILANAYARRFFDARLHSDYGVSDSARGAWKSLEKKGLVESYAFEDKLLYRFK